ncbi:hypothetical protein JCM8547_000668 [Rhodosporidiobolus lusitaniae]
MAPLKTLLCTYPIERKYNDLFAQLRATFETVHFYPGEDGSGTETEYGPIELPPPEVYASCDAILAFVMPTNLTNISQTPRLKLWGIVGSGTRMVTDTDFYRSIPEGHPLRFFNLAGCHSISISEHVIMTTLMHFHRMSRCIEASRQQHWAGPMELGGPSGSLFIRELRSLTVGILAYGGISREIARLFSAFGSKVIVCTRAGKPQQHTGFRIEGTGDPDGSIPSKYYGMDKESVKEFLVQCDVVVSMLPSSQATYQFIGREELTVMKDNALFVNCGRGDTVDTAALIDALSSKEAATGKSGTFQIGGASLDVTDPEPLPDGHVLFSMDNVIVTPHCSYASESMYDRVMKLLMENKVLVEKGAPVLNEQGDGKREAAAARAT